MSQSRVKLFIATPCYGGVVTVEYMRSVIGLLGTLGNQRIPNNLALLSNDSLVTRARNKLVARFLEDKEATHMMFIDSDIGFDPQTVLRLLAHDRDVVAGVYPKRGYDWNRMLVAVERGERDIRAAALDYAVNLASREVEGKHKAIVENGLLMANEAATGFLMIKRSVFQRMIEAMPELEYVSDEPEYPDRMHSFFDTMHDRETGRYLSEDYAFCRRWRDIGGDIWVDPAIRLDHVGRAVFEGDIASVLQPNK